MEYYLYGVLNSILVSSLSSLSVYDNTLQILRAINSQEDTFPNSFNVTWVKQNYCHDCTSDELNQTTAEKKNAPNDIVRVHSLGDNTEWSSITKKTNDST